MRDLTERFFNECRLPGYANAYQFGFAATGATIRVIATTYDAWDHVSVTVNAQRCPIWAELEAVKRAFFKDDETAMQLHVPPTDHVNIHPYCLHLWRPNDGREIPRPPMELVR